MDVMDSQRNQSIGKLLLQSGKLKPEDADKILHEQVVSGTRFGDAAVKLGLLKQKDIDEALSKQFEFSYINTAETKVDSLVISAYQPFSSSVEQIRALRGQLGIRWFDERKSLVLLGPESKVGNSVICANLAVSFAQLGKKTLLIDANMRHPTIHSLFNLENKRGFSDILVSRSNMDVIHRFEGVDNLSIMTSGAIPPNPVELLGRSELGQLITELENLFDVIIYDTPAALDYCDAQMLLAKIKGAVLTVKKNRTSMNHIEQVKKEFAVINAEIIGSVLNEF